MREVSMSTANLVSSSTYKCAAKIEVNTFSALLRRSQGRAFYIHRSISFGLVSLVESLDLGFRSWLLSVTRRRHLPRQESVRFLVKVLQSKTMCTLQPLTTSPFHAPVSALTYWELRTVIIPRILALFLPACIQSQLRFTIKEQHMLQIS